MFRKEIITILAGVILFGVSLAQAVDVDFYSDAIIIPGDVYEFVSVYDTPPDHTTVDMFGGSIRSIYTHHSSIFNIHEGEIWWGILTRDSSTVNIFGGTISLESFAVSDSSKFNLYGGDFASGNSPYFSEASTVNIYGYGFNYDGFLLTGFLSDDSPFESIEIYPSDYAHINLITVVYAEVDIKPESLNLASKGKWITCKIWLPEDYNVADVNSATIRLQGQVPADWLWFNEKQNVVMAKFSRSEIAEILEPGDVELTVAGYLMDGSYFVGTDTIKVIDKGHKND